MEIHTAEPLVPDPSPFEVEIATANLGRYKLQGNDHILTELNQTEGEELWSQIHKLLNSLWSKEELPDQWKESIIVLIYKKGDKIGCSNYLGISLLSDSYKMLSNILP
jgi:alkylated DNA repair dioxygenase AlkB